MHLADKHEQLMFLTNQKLEVPVKCKTSMGSIGREGFGVFSRGMRVIRVLQDDVACNTPVACTPVAQRN